MKKIFSFVILLIIFTTISGCSNSNDIRFDISGKIIRVYFNRDSEVTSIYVEANDNTKEYDKAIIRIDSKTIILDKNNNEIQDKLQINDIVNVIFDGPVIESYPIQVTAKQIYRNNTK